MSGSSGINRVTGFSRVTRDAASEGLDRKAAQPAGKGTQAVAPERNQQLYEAAKQYEKYFLDEMMKAMRSTVSFSDQTKPSMGEGIYRDQLDQQYTEVWADKGGIGLSDMIYDQMMDRYFGGGSPGAFLKSQGPIALSDRDISRVMHVTPGSQSAKLAGQTALRVEVKPATDGGPAKILSPWDAQVVSNSRLDGRSALVLDHGTGLRSTLIFQGVAAAAAEAGQKIQKGSTLGVLSPEAKSFLWNMNQQMAAAIPDAGPGAATGVPE